LFLEDMMLEEQQREDTVVALFTYALNYELLDLTILVWDHYEVFLVKNSERCIESLIGSFNKSPQFLQMKLYVLNKFVKLMKYN